MNNKSRKFKKNVELRQSAVWATAAPGGRLDGNRPKAIKDGKSDAGKRGLEGA